MSINMQTEETFIDWLITNFDESGMDDESIKAFVLDYYANKYALSGEQSDYLNELMSKDLSAYLIMEIRRTMEGFSGQRLDKVSKSDFEHAFEVQNEFMMI